MRRGAEVVKKLAVTGEAVSLVWCAGQFFSLFLQSARMVREL